MVIFMKKLPMKNQGGRSSISIISSSEQYFSEVLTQAFMSRKIEAPIQVKNYLVGILQFYLDSRNLFDEETVDESGRRKPQSMAEMYMIAHQSESSVKTELLKKLADKSLYISGFFSDSLQRKIIDVDYYAEMGGSAYASLAHCTREDTLAYVYRVFSKRFLEFVDVLSILSQQSQLQSNQNILRLYDRYLRTGSELDRERLAEMGLLTADLQNRKKTVLS